MQKLITIILKDINYADTKKNRDLIESIVSERTNNIEYVWDKIPSLIQKISSLKGFLGISNSKQSIKIGFDRKSVSKEINDEFHSIVDYWSKKYKISLAYDWEKETYYIN